MHQLADTVVNSFSADPLQALQAESLTVVGDTLPGIVPVRSSAPERDGAIDKPFMDLPPVYPDPQIRHDDVASPVDTAQPHLAVVEDKRYSVHADKIHIDLLETCIYDLTVYVLGHVKGVPVHRLEKNTRRKSDSAFTSMYQLACELFPEWKANFDALANAGGEE